MPILPDVLRSGLRIVFCGSAAGNVSAARGAYYAHPQNRFWPTLHSCDLIGRALAPEDFARVLEWDIGLTDIAKNVSGTDSQLPPGSLGPEACAALAAKVIAIKPYLLAFTSKRAGGSFCRARVAYGEQPQRLGPTRLWVLPSPSPLAQTYWDEAWWRRLAEAAREAA